MVINFVSVITHRHSCFVEICAAIEEWKIPSVETFSELFIYDTIALAADEGRPSAGVPSTFTFSIEPQMFSVINCTSFTLFSRFCPRNEKKWKSQKKKWERARRKMDSFPIFLGSGLVTKFSPATCQVALPFHLLLIWFWSIESRRFWLF